MNRTKKAVVAIALGVLAVTGSTGAAAPQQSDTVVAIDRKCC